MSDQPSARRGPVRVLWNVFGALLLVGALSWGAYQVVVLLAHEERTEVASYRGVETIDVSNGAGPVRIVAGDSDDVVVTSRISDGLRSTGNRHAVANGVLELRASCPNFGSDFCYVGYTIEVPRDIAVVARSGHDSVTLSGLAGSVRASSDNGRVEATDLRSASVEADSDNGRVELQFTEAPTTVTATADNGSVEVIVPNDGEAYRLDVESANGSTTEAVPVNSASSRSITVQTDNGRATVRTAE